MRIPLSSEEKELLLLWSEGRTEEPLDPSNLFQPEDFLIGRLSTDLPEVDLDGDAALTLLVWFNRLDAPSAADLALAGRLRPLWESSLPEDHPELARLRTTLKGD